MPDYNLTGMGSRAFEQLIVSLCRADLGAGVEAFGDGRDGGREATFDGTINWSNTAVEPNSTHDQWAGYTVVQAKYMVKPKPEPIDNAVWLQGQIRTEINSWVKAKKAKKRTRYPDYLIFVTNVDLSPVAKTGGIDTVAALVRTLIGPGSDAQQAGLTIRDFRIWHADQIRSMLDAHQSIRYAFDGLVTVGDVLSALTRDRQLVGTLHLDDPLRQDLVVGLESDSWIRLSQSGGGPSDKLSIGDVVVDLPAIVNGKADDLVRAARHILERGDTVLRQSQTDRSGSPGVVLVGGPGQGKTTLSQLIAQAYRAALLDPADLRPQARSTVEATIAALARLGLALPGNRRWPVRVDLAKYAEELASGADTSLLRWISALVSKRATNDVTPAQLHSWQRVCPWAVILDGLDEVPSLAARRQLYQQIEAFTAAAGDDDVDLLVVLTTRPTGYDERLPEPWYEHLDLQPLPAAESLQFAQQLTAKRFEADRERGEQVAQRLAGAAADPTTVRMMETPLQVTVMSMIVEKFPRPPSNRFRLFDLYYETMFDREVAKDISASHLLEVNREHINGIHAQVGLLLQVQSEAAEHAEAVLSAAELERVANDVLLRRGFDQQEAAATARQLVGVALLRLVLLVPREAGLGFEIRTLQETMAARAISEGRDEEVLDRLRLIADHPHWRNTWLLAVGRLLTTSSRFENLIAGLLRGLPEGPGSLGRRMSSGPAIAAALIDDGHAERRPGFHRQLREVALSALSYPPIGDRRTVATALARLLSGPHRASVLERFSSRTDADAAGRAAAAALFDLVAPLAESRPSREAVDRRRGRLRLSEAEETALRMFLTNRPNHPDCLGSFDGTGRLETEPFTAAVARAVGSEGLTDEEAARLADGLRAFGESSFYVTGDAPEVAVLACVDVNDEHSLLDVVTDDSLAAAIDMGLSTLPLGYWSIPALVAERVFVARRRTPVGERLAAAVEASAIAAASS